MSSRIERKEHKVGAGRDRPSLGFGELAAKLVLSACEGTESRKGRKKRSDVCVAYCLRPVARRTEIQFTAKDTKNANPFS